tara:strand:- start:284 stop:445 length:162 start_codon:yes stop_codon:yes gene_type:complete
MSKDVSVDHNTIEINMCIRCLEKIEREDRVKGNKSRASSIKRAIMQLKMAQRF